MLKALRVPTIQSAKAGDNGAAGIQGTYPLMSHHPSRYGRSYYRGTDGCLLVFDITDRKSFEALPRWLDEARMNSANPDLSVMLIANKADLAEK